MNFIEIQHLSKRFADQLLFDDVSLSFPERGFFAIVGDSGCGKSTLLNYCAGLAIDYAGEMTVLGVSLKTKSEEERGFFRLREIGYLRQDGDLLELESAIDNVILPALAFRKTKQPLLKRKAMGLLSLFGIRDKAFQRVNTLSGGERQRVALARALIHDPPILLCDEPTGALDGDNADKIYSFLGSIASKRLVIVVSHDQERSRQFADSLLFLKNGKLIIEANDRKKRSSSSLLLPKTDSFASSPSIPLWVWLCHAYRLLKAKKGRSALSSFIIGFSLFSFGFSAFVSRDLSTQLSRAFSSLCGEGSVVMESLSPQERSFGKIISAPETDMQRLVETYPAFVDDYGLSYLAPFESFFPQRNEGLVLTETGRFLIPSFSSRTINDYLWLDRYSSRRFYPAVPSAMEGEQVALGIPSSTMTALCFQLRILRNFEALGHYLSVQPLSLLLHVQNDEWGYEDEQLFTIVSVTENDAPTLYHYQHRWNAFILEEKMRFPSIDEPEGLFPWALRKVFYLEPRGTSLDFLQKAREMPALADYVFEKASFEYEQTHCRKGEATELTRLYVYLADKFSLSFSLIEEVGKSQAFSSFHVCASGSYVSFPEALSSGFSNPFYLSKTRESITAITESVSWVKKSEKDKALQLPSDACSGVFLRPKSTCLTFSSDFSSLSHGRLPVGIEEVCLSSALYDKWGQPSAVFAAGLVQTNEVGEILQRDYRSAELKVVGCIENDNQVIYSSSYWLIDFWRETLGMSAFELEPRQMILQLTNPSESEEICSSFTKRYPGYRFVDPFASVSASIGEVTNYIDLTLEIASISTLSISFLLLLTVALISTLENKREGRMLFYLGVSRTDITNNHGSSLFLLIFYCLFFAGVSLLFSEFVMDQTIQNNFGTKNDFSIDIVPFLLLLIFAAINLLFVLFWIFQWVKKRNFRTEGR